MNRKKVVVIGGGHGQSAILRGIKNIQGIELTAIVTVADDGGSTGRLRRHFHIPAMGDIRNVLISLAESETLLSTLMEYRFEGTKEEDVLGHNLGNLILTAMTQASGSFMESIETLSKVLNVKGRILPASSQVITLFARMQDGTIVRGESNIPKLSNRISKVYYEEEVKAMPAAVEAIREADIIIYGIGSVYTSILPNLIIPDINKAIAESKAKVLYFCNAMTQAGETDGYTLEDHVEAFFNHGSRVDLVIYANNEIPEKVIEKYALEGAIPVVIKNRTHQYPIYDYDLLDFDQDLIRHNSMKIKQCFEELLKKV